MKISTTNIAKWKLPYNTGMAIKCIKSESNSAVFTKAFKQIYVIA